MVVVLGGRVVPFCFHKSSPYQTVLKCMSLELFSLSLSKSVNVIVILKLCKHKKIRNFAFLFLWYQILKTDIKIVNPLLTNT